MGKLNEKTFSGYQDFIYKQTGIRINPNKKDLLEMKLNRTVADNDVQDTEDLLESLTKKKSAQIFQGFVNHLTTNTTEFFRERHHFDYVSGNIKAIMADIPRIAQNKEIRIWIAGSSSGQEAVTLTMILKEALPEYTEIKMLATDINSQVLNKAINGLYSESDCRSLPESYKHKYFEKVTTGYQVKKNVLKHITYRYFNLRQEYKSKNRFDIIFCRNVMIYFDNDFQQELINKFSRNLVSNGFLFVGHSESLMNKEHDFTYVGPSIYTNN